MRPSARVILDSISPDGIRLTTMEITIHRYVLAEFNTHRAFSRNSASSRAIPVKKRIQAVIDNCAYPLHWGENQPGMQAAKELPPDKIEKALTLWNDARDRAVEIAQDLMELGVHKQVANRLLEPFAWQTMIVTAAYETTGNQEQLVNIANYCWLEYNFPEHKKAHLATSVGSKTRGVMP